MSPTRTPSSSACIWSAAPKTCSVPPAPAGTRSHRAAAPVRQSGQHKEHGSSQVDRHHQVPLVEPDVGHAAPEHDTGVVDHHIDSSEPLDSVLHGRIDRGRSAQVGLDVGDLRVALRDGVEFTSLDHRDLCPLREVAIDDAAADSPSAAGDESDLACQLHCVPLIQLPRWATVPRWISCDTSRKRSGPVTSPVRTRRQSRADRSTLWNRRQPTECTERPGPFRSILNTKFRSNDTREGECCGRQYRIARERRESGGGTGKSRAAEPAKSSPGRIASRAHVSTALS